MSIIHKWLCRLGRVPSTVYVSGKSEHAYLFFLDEYLLHTEQKMVTAARLNTAIKTKSTMTKWALWRIHISFPDFTLQYKELCSGGSIFCDLQSEHVAAETMTPHCNKQTF